jgi:hypothetical protein
LTLLFVIPSAKVVVKVESVVPHEDSSVLIGSVTGKVGSVVVIISSEVVVIISPGVVVIISLAVVSIVVGEAVISDVSDDISASVDVDDISLVGVVVELVESVPEGEDVSVVRRASVKK